MLAVSSLEGGWIIRKVAAGGGTADITSNLQAHYDFEDSSTTSTADGSPNGNNLTLYNVVGRVTGVVGSNALYLDGINKNGADLTPTNLQITGDLTVALWVNVDDLPASAAEMVDYGNNTESENGNRLYRFFVDSAGAYAISWEYGEGANANPVAANTALSVDTWYHLAIVRTVGATSSVQYYINGSPDGSDSAIANASGGSISKFYVGVNEGNSPGRYLAGALDDVRIYNRALTATDIAALVALGSP